VGTRARLAENPFFVLELPPTASRVEIERAGQRLLAELALNREGSMSYRTPVGKMERTADAIRAAVSELRDPARRLEHELWAAVPVQDGNTGSAGSLLSWAAASSVFGLKAR
jgi:curved DNA-binding protein CbpA